MRIVIAEDSLLVRSLLVEVLTSAGHEVEQASSPEELFAVVEERPADLVMLDIRMPPTFTDEGIRAAERLRQQDPSSKVLVLSQHAEAAFVTRLLNQGASGLGYLLKERVMNLDALKDAITRVAAGACVVDPVLVDELMRKPEERDPLAHLSTRERDVLRLIAEGYSDNGIAVRLQLSRRTVETHVMNIVRKLGLSNSPDVNRRVSAVLTWLRAAES